MSWLGLDNRIRLDWEIADNPLLAVHTWAYELETVLSINATLVKQDKSWLLWLSISWEILMTSIVKLLQMYLLY